jgi:hypothetical protein
MAAQLAVQIAHLVFIASSLTAGQNAWQNYSELFGRWLNSGYLAIPLSLSRVIIMLDLLERNDEDVNGYFQAFLGTSVVGYGRDQLQHANRFVLKLAAATLLPMLAPLVTHILPAFVIFPWLPLLLFLAGCLLMLLHFVFVWNCCPLYGLPEYATEMLLVLVTIMLLPLLQTLLNYAILFYDGDSYADTIVHEFQLRSTSCWLAAQREGMRKAVASLLFLL